MKQRPANRRLRGFTLMETLLAIGLVGILLSIFLTVFVPARGMVRQALTRQEAERISGILRAEMSFLRPDEQASAGATAASDGQFLSPFDKAFFWMQHSRTPANAIVIFSYRADTTKSMRADGTYPPVPASRNIPGQGNQLITLACPLNDSLHKDDIKDAVGPAFLVKMTQIVDAGGGKYQLAGQPGSISGATSPDKYVSEDGEKNPWGGVVIYRADFYHMSPPNPARYKGKSWKRLGRPMFSVNMSFRR